MNRPFLTRLTGLMLVASTAIANAAVPHTVDGTWLNPKGSVAVRTGACGDRVCGWIVWANGGALEDARESNIPHLIGTPLLEDYRPAGPNIWKGTVFVPDMGRHFSSTITRLAGDSLEVKGCLIGGFFCKSQTWHRIERLPGA